MVLTTSALQCLFIINKKKLKS